MMILQEKQGITKVIKIKHGSSIVVRSLHVLPFLKSPISTVCNCQQEMRWLRLHSDQFRRSGKMPLGYPVVGVTLA